MTEIAKLTANGELELDFDRATVEQAYDRWAPVYDLVFGGVFSKGRRAAIVATNAIGGRVLEVGVGTADEIVVTGKTVGVVGIKCAILVASEDPLPRRAQGNKLQHRAHSDQADEDQNRGPQSHCPPQARGEQNSKETHRCRCRDQRADPGVVPRPN